MAPNPRTLRFLLNLTILLALATHALSAGRMTPTHSENTDPKKPQSFIDTDGSFLIPGVGRYTFPGVGTPFNPFTYNPVTGTSGGVATPTGFASAGSGGNIPSGDDTFVPTTPGGEVPSAVVRP